MRYGFMILLAFAIACARGPTIEPPSTAMTTVNASYDETWESAIEVFAEETYLIAALEKVSGLIASEDMFVREGMGFADCGVNNLALPLGASTGRFNFRVEEDNEVVRIKVTARWGNAKAKNGCISTGSFESSLEELIRTRAEGETAEDSG